MSVDANAQQTNRVELNNATERLRAIYKRYNGTFEVGENNHPTITEINRWINLPRTSAYCGSTIVWMCKEAGLELVDIPITKMGLAYNWKRYGKTLWDISNGWRPGAKKLPADDEIYVLYFNWNGRGHVGVVLWYHGGVNFITGEGNTSNAKVRRKKYGELNEAVMPPPMELYVPYKTVKGVPQYRQGIFAYKERYRTQGLVAIVSVQVKFLN